MPLPQLSLLLLPSPLSPLPPPNTHTHLPPPSRPPPLPLVRFHKSVFKMERGLPPNKLVPKFRNNVDEYRNLLPVIQALRNNALRERHWQKVFESIGTTLPRDSSLTLQVRLGMSILFVCPGSSGGGLATSVSIVRGLFTADVHVAWGVV